MDVSVDSASCISASCISESYIKQLVIRLNQKKRIDAPTSFRRLHAQRQGQQLSSVAQRPSDAALHISPQAHELHVTSARVLEPAPLATPYPVPSHSHSHTDR